MIKDNASEEFQASPGLNQSHRNRVKKWTATIIRSLISLALLGVLLRVADVHAIPELLGEAKLGVLLLIILWLFLDRMLHAWRWILLLRAKMKDLPVLMLIRVHFISNFLANFLPFNVGNDVTRVVSIAKYSGNTVYPLSSVIVDRIMGLVSLAVSVALVVAGVLLWQVYLISSEVVWTILGVLAILVCFGVILWKGILVRKIITLLGDSAANKWVEKIIQVYDACLSYGTHRVVIFKVFLILQLSLINGILITYLTARAFGIDVPAIYFFLFVPIISFLSLLPISANGIGISEGGFVFLFCQVGASTAEALTLALTMRVLMILVTLPGGLLLAVGGLCPKRSA